MGAAFLFNKKALKSNRKQLDLRAMRHLNIILAKKASVLNLSAGRLWRGEKPLYIHNWIPEEFIIKLLGSGNPFGVILATIAGVPMYADIFGTQAVSPATINTNMPRKLSAI